MPGGDLIPLFYRKKMLIIDSSTLIYSAFYKFGLTNWKNEPTGIIYGFLDSTLMLANKLQTKNVVFCFDSRSSLRKEFFRDYKSRHNNLTEEEIEIAKLRRKQEDKIKSNILRKIGFKNIFYNDGYEADDLISYLVRKYPGSTVATNDCDLYQNLNYCQIIDPKGKDILTKKDFSEKYKINPDMWVLAKAIGGCLSDQIPGIKGIGDPKNSSSKALKFINGELKGKLYEKIISEEGQEIISRNLRLVTCPYDNYDFNISLRKNRITKERIELVLRQFSFYNMLKEEKFKLWNIFLD